MTRTWTERVRAAVRRRATVDRRALAAFRIALGAVLLLDLLRRGRDLRVFYTDAGVLPRTVLRTVYPGWSALSLHALSGGLWLQALLFALAGLAAVALLVGYRTRLATLASLVLLVSLHARNPLVLNAGDILLQRLLFWGLFLPLGSRWAVDAPADTDRTVAGVAVLGLLAQVVAVYATNAVVKLRGGVWLSGDAVRYAFAIDHFTVLLGDLLAGVTPLLTLADWAWLALLVASPLLVVLVGRLRSALAAAFVVGHLGMALTLAIGVFPLVSVAGLLPFLHGGVWGRVERRIPDRTLPSRPRPPVADQWPTLSGLGRAVAAVALVLVVVVNAVGLGVVAAPAGTPDRISERSWDMFAPSPPRATWWYAAPATLASGEQVDALTGGPVSRSRPPDPADRYPNERWRKFLDDARRDERLRPTLAAYLCTRWNRRHDDRLVRLELVYLVEPTDLDGPETVRRESLGTYDCPG